MANKSCGPIIGWWGQIVNDAVWKENLPGSKWNFSDELPGYGTRYRVAILGRDSQNKDTPDEKLEWADVLYPVTAGSGHGGSYETSNLRKGAFVFGTYRDLIHMTQPVILGCLGNNEQIPLSQTVPLNNFVPFSGFIKEQVPVTNIPPEESSPPVVTYDTPNGPIKKDEKQPREGANSSTRGSLADEQANKDGNTENSLPVSTTCDKIQLGRIQTEIKKFIAEIQKFKSQISSILKPIKEDGTEYSLSEYILYKAQNVAKIISGWLRNIINFIQQKVKEKINNAIKDFYYFLFPNQRPNLKKAVEIANNSIDCLIRKIVSNLLKIATDLLLKIAERFINAPLCAIESIISNVLGQILGLVTGIVTNIIQPIEAIIGGVIDLAGDILSLIDDVLSFLSCDDKPDCPKVVGWTPWTGASKLNLGGDINKILSKAKNIASSVKQITDINNFDFNLDFDGIFEDTCNVGPILCGLPTVEFFGGGGSGAQGNAIVSASGEILGVDITSFGSGYTSAPTINFVDSCGTGKNAVGEAVIGPVVVSTGGLPGIGTTGSSGIGSTTVTGVVKIKMINTGSNYLSAPNGNLGGDGRTWATKEQTTVKRNDGTYDRPYNPGETFSLNPGDEVTSCGKTLTILESQNYTAPKCPDISPLNGNGPTLDSGKYPVFLELDSVAIKSPGVNYNPDKDKIVITPDHGAKLNAVFDSLGSLRRVDVIKTGIGFTEMPTVEIETESGYNASLIPVFKVNRIGNAPTDAPAGVQIINVVDCVGKFYG